MNKKKIAFYHCHTPLHIGSGTTLDIIDLPIQREAHTDFPIMPSTSIKGVIRGEYWINKVDNNPEIPDEPPEECFETINNKKVFKKDNNNEKCKFFDLFGFGDKEGDIIFTDGKILLFPVKSVKGVFAWITCPLVLERFERDIGIDLGAKSLKIDDESAKAMGNEIVINGGDENYLVLEELSFKVENNGSGIIENLYNQLPQELKDNTDKEKIAILSNNNFRYFVKNHTEVNARIRINQETGTVDKETGALWYEELVPAETVFYNLILSRTDSEDNINTITDFINDKIFQFGGDETLGRGFTKVYIKEEE